MQARLRLVDGWIDLDRGQVERSEEVSLTEREVRLIRYLAARPPTPCSTEELLREVWGYHERVRSRAVAAVLHRLRRKLEVDPKHPSHLVTVYGKGVYFRPAEPETRHAEADFVGRDDALAQVLEALDGGQSVLVTGAGGVGKTRLAREVLAQREGVFCSLAQSGDVSGAARAVAWALGVDLASSDPADGLADLAEAMAARGVMVLDNGEHLDGIAAWVDRLGPDVRVLLTSRRREDADLVHVALGPLDVEAGVALLRSLTGLGPGPELASVVERVGGLPLALHLVHRHFSWLAPAEVALQARRLVDEAEEPGPHGSLHAVVQGSLDYLPPDARDGFVRLGALPHAPWPFEAAAAVVGSLDSLKALVDASLLERREGGVHLLEMHPLVHEQLNPSAADAQEAHQRLQGWFVPWCQPLLHEEAPDQLAALFGLAPLLEAVPSPVPEVVYLCGLAAYERGDLKGALRHVESGQAATRSDTLVGLRLRLLRCQIERRAGRAEAAARSLAAELEGALGGAPSVQSAGWQVVAGAWASLGRHHLALQAYDRAAVGAAGRAPVERALLRLDRCKSEAALGQLNEAYEHAQEAWGELDGGPVPYAVNGLNTLGTLALRLGRLGTARGWFELALLRVQDDPLRAAVVHSNLAALELSRGVVESALTHADAALQAHRRTGRRRGMVIARSIRGRALLLGHRWQAAVPELEQARALADAVGVDAQSRWARGFLAIALAELGHSDEAAEQLRVADLDDDVGRLAAAHVARSRGEPASVSEDGVSPELRAHVRAFAASSL